MGFAEILGKGGNLKAVLLILKGFTLNIFCKGICFLDIKKDELLARLEM